ncbi:hypothetical protein C7212DRAFT_285702 [Tuber magnatum]|uniref:Uncharacterized protein n=1 Tax=Tuber magnatum TaxID=42249 RepID=A0A317SE86_9PEZI|nr:hypothetical protein C7212DRAFT_285702 [Tuber magnatum]
MPVYSEHSKNPRQQQQNRNSSTSPLASNPVPIAAQATAISSTFGGGSAFSSSRARIYPREYGISRNSAQKSPHPSNTTSPLLSALQSPGEILSRSIPFPTILSSSTPSTGAPNSLGSASGGVGLGVGGASPPPSAPASYSSGGNFGAARQVRGYPGFEEQYSCYGHGGYYNPTQRYAQGSPSPLNAQFGAAATVNTRLRPGEGNFACTFDTLDEPAFGGANGGFMGLAVSGGNGNGGGENVVCLGWEGGVDVWKVGRGVVEQVGRLEGLGGGVKGAKILPTPPRDDPLAAHRPLVCLTLHSPVTPQAAPEGERPPPIMQDETPYSTSPHSRPSTSASNRSAHSPEQPTEWQTTVEVWSLSSRTRIAKLFTSPSVPAADFSFGMGSPPPPWGGLRVEVVGTKIVIGVGISGELYVYGLSSGNGLQGDSAGWKCLGKLWTAIQGHSGGSFSSDTGVPGLGSEGKVAGIGGYIGAPVFSLSNGWLAYCPASAGSACHVGGEVGVPFSSPTVKSQSPPAQPAITAAVSLEDEAFLNRMAREVTQEVIRGAKRATEASIKAFQNYWNGPQNNSPPPPAPPLPVSMMNSSIYGIPNMGAGSVHGGPQPSGLGQQLRQMQQMGGVPQQSQFPQHTPPQQSASEPRLVSIIDLSKVSHSLDGGMSLNGLQVSTTPMATFLPPAGVSYLSFAPGGLALLTASSKGDLLFVWDLMRVVHHPPGNPLHGGQKSGPGVQDSTKLSGPSNGPDGGALGRHVRQIARFSRITPTTVVDVGWSSPKGEKLTVVTERGTVHFYDLPSGAYQWPPPKRPPPSPSVITAGAQVGAAGAAVTGAVNLFNSSTQPLLSAARKRRSRSSSIGSPSGGIFLNGNSNRRPGQAGSGSGSPNDHIGGNKVSLPQGLGSIRPGSVKFLVGKERGYVALTGAGVLRIYEVRPGGAGSKKKNAGGIMSNFLEYELPMLPDGPSQQNTLSVDGEEKQVGGYWIGRHHHHHHHPVHNIQQQKFEQSPLSFAEIETNAVFQPFHTDRHVNLFVHTDAAGSHGLLQLTPRAAGWLAGSSRQAKVCRRKDEDQSIAPTSPSSSPRPEPALGLDKTECQSPLPATPPPEEISVPEPVPEPASDMPLAAAPVTGPTSESGNRWAFGLLIPAEKLNIGSARGEVEFTGDKGGLTEAMESRLELDRSGRSMIKKGRKGGRGRLGPSGEGFFENDCEVLEYTGTV